MSQANAVLAAGGLVPVKTKVDQESTVDPISARIYRHPALGDRPVVRLTADSLAKGDDLAMEFLGFEAPEVQGPLALRRRQALGFPGWALINDPDHARYALELVKEFRKEARRAKSKPGHAYDAFVEIAKRLDRSVAHFLPSYWEEVGREFMQAGNSTYAARAFGKAREAEKVHSLTVDETLRQDAFLEFALAGCLSNKALTEYCRDLQDSRQPAEAWATFRELCVRRTLGGMPPWATMTKELGQLISAAGLDVEAELQGLLKEVVESPSMSRAAMGFWKACSKTLKALAAKDDHVAGVLLNLLPETSYWDHDNVWTWLGFLEEWGLLSNAWEDGVSEAAGPREGAAAWFQRFVELDANPPQRIHNLLKSMADRLRRDGKPVNLTAKGNNTIHVDLLDLALELKIPVADPNKHTGFNLCVWAVPGEDSIERPRDPIFVHADPRFRPVLEMAVANVAGNALFEPVATGKLALADARKAWLLGEIASIGKAALPGASEVLERLQRQTWRATFQEFPEAFDELQKVDLEPVLQRTLQGGLIDEFGWPALEEAVEQLNPKGDQELKFFRNPPHVVVSNGLTILVAGPSGIVLEHEIKATKKQKLEDAFFLDGQLLVVLQSDRWDNVMYWSSNPKKTIELSYYYQRDRDGFSVVLESGGTFIGSGTVHAGDEKEPRFNEFFHDGEHFWKYGWHNDEMAMREISTAGDVGRKSLPSFLEDYLKDGMELSVGDCSLMSVGDWARSSPLGCVGGTIGWRVRHRKRMTTDEDGDPVETFSDVECERIDGKAWSGYLGTVGVSNSKLVPDGLIDWPGSDRPRPFSENSSYRQSGSVLWDADGEVQLASLSTVPGPYDCGQATGLPPKFWHAFQVRDLQSSKALRSVSAKQTKALLSAAVAERGSVGSDLIAEERLPALPQTQAVIRKWLSKLKSDRLERGICGAVYFAAGLVEQLEELRVARDPAREDVADGGQSLPGHLSVVYEFLAGQREGCVIAAPSYDWIEGLLDGVEQKIVSEFWLKDGKVSEDQLSRLTMICDVGFPDLPGRFRRYEVEFAGKPPIKLAGSIRGDDTSPQWALYESKGNRFILWKDYDWQDEFTVVEYAPDGIFQMLPGGEIDADDVSEVSRVWSSEQMRGYLAAFTERGEEPWPDDTALQAAADQLGVTRGEVALVWCGLPNFDTWGANFLPKPLRERMGLKVNEAKAAREAIKNLKPELQASLVAAVLSGPAEDLWDDGGQRALARLVEAWGGSAPKRLDAPPEIMKALDDATGYASAADHIAALADPKKHPRLKAGVKWRLGEKAHRGRVAGADSLDIVCDAEDTFDSEMLNVVTLAVPLLYSALPGGAEAANLVVVAWELALKCLDKPGLMLPLGSRYFWGQSEGKARETFKNIVGQTSSKDGADIAEIGLLVGGANDHTVQLGFRSAKAKTDSDLKKLRAALTALLSGADSYSDNKTLLSFELIRSQGYSAICERIKSGKIAEGKYDSNPLLSAPNVVARVATKHKLSEEAAVLYLQLLTLHDPTTANLKLWNDWTTAQIGKAVKELLARKLILEAKRARAGRAVFIPGGWEPLKAPLLPIESWKLPLYEAGRNVVTGKLEFPLCRILPLRPLGELFAAAWERVVKGDAPKYEEVS